MTDNSSIPTQQLPPYGNELSGLHNWDDSLQLCCALSLQPIPSGWAESSAQVLSPGSAGKCSVLIPAADSGSCEWSRSLSGSGLALRERWISTVQGYQTTPSCQALPTHAQRHRGPMLRCCQTSRVVISLEGQWPLSLWKRVTFQDRQDVPDWG